MVYSADIAIHVGYLIPMIQEGAVIEDATVLVKDSKILYAGKQLDKSQIQAHDSLYLKDSVLLPPFFNQHTHPSISLYRGLGADLRLKDWLEKVIWPLEKRFCTPERVLLGSQLSLVEMIKSGTGAIAAMDFYNDQVGQALELAGIRGYLGEAIFKISTPNASEPKEAFDYTAQLVNTYQSSELVRVHVAIHAPFTADIQLYEQAREFADRFNLMITSHIAETDRERQWALREFGKTPVQWIADADVIDNRFIVIHGVQLDDRDISILADLDAPLIHNPHSNMVLGSGVCRVPDLHKAGVRVGLGTDSAGSNNGLSMLKEMQTMNRLQKVYWKNPELIPAAQALHMATAQGYQIYEYPDCGQIIKGNKADFQIINLNNANQVPDTDPISGLAYSVHSEDVTHLMVNGKMIMENRSINTLDEEIILKEVRNLSREIYSFSKREGILS